MQAQILSGKWILGPVPDPAQVPVPALERARDRLEVKEGTKVPKEAVAEAKDLKMDPCTKDLSRLCIKALKSQPQNR